MDGAATLEEAEVPGVLREPAELLAANAVELPMAATYPLQRVADAFDHLERGHALGKIVLWP